MKFLVFLIICTTFTSYSCSVSPDLLRLQHIHAQQLPITNEECTVLTRTLGNSLVQPLPGALTLEGQPPVTIVLALLLAQGTGEEKCMHNRDGRLPCSEDSVSPEFDMNPARGQKSDFHTLPLRNQV